MSSPPWPWQVGIDRHVQSGWAAFNPAQYKVLHRIEADCPHIERLLHRSVQIGKREAFQQAQYLHILAPAMLAHARLHEATQRLERLGQIPALQGCGLIEGTQLLFDQGKVMDWVEDHVFALVAAHMAGNDLAPATDHHFADIAPDPHLLVAEADRHRVIVGPVTHQRLRRDLPAGLVTGLERRRRQVLHRRQIAPQPLADRLVLAP